MSNTDRSLRTQTFNTDPPTDDAASQQAERAREHAEGLTRIARSGDLPPTLETQYHDAAIHLDTIATVHQEYANGDLNAEEIPEALHARHGGRR